MKFSFCLMFFSSTFFLFSCSLFKLISLNCSTILTLSSACSRSFWTFWALSDSISSAAFYCFFNTCYYWSCFLFSTSFSNDSIFIFDSVNFCSSFCFYCSIISAWTRLFSSIFLSSSIAFSFCLSSFSYRVVLNWTMAWERRMSFISLFLPASSDFYNL